MENYLVINVERAKAGYAIVSDELDILEQGNEYTSIDSKEGLFEPLRDLADRVRDQVVGVSVTMPGVIDSQRGIAYSGGVYQWVKDMPYAQELSEFIDLPVVIANDAKAACLAEIGYGSLKRIQNGIMLLILNTGIGGAVVTNGEILNGHHFAAGEFSYMRGDYRHRDGHSDMFALANSIDSLARMVEKKSGKRNLNVLRIMSKVTMGDEDVRAGVEEYLDQLATYIYNIQCVVDAEVCVIGGTASNEPVFLKMMEDALKRKFDDAPFQNIFPPKIKECCFHTNSRTYGAVYNFRKVTGRI